MVILGLTGSIGMGKSTAAGMFRRMGYRVYDSDAAVHEVFARGGAAVAPIEAAFPGVVVDGAVDRGRLGARVFGDDAALARLEGIVHPLVRRAQDDFLRRAARDGERLVVLDVPLMYEVGLDTRCDAVVVVSAPAFVQRARVLSRPGMTEEKFRAILARQMPDAEKRRRADFVVPTGRGKSETLSRLARIARVMSKRKGRKWPPSPYRENRPGRRAAASGYGES